MQRTSLIVALTVGSLLAGAALVSAQDAKETKQGKKGGGPGIEQREAMAERLGLKEDQKAKFKAIMDEGMAKRQELRNDTSLSQEQRREKMRAFTEEQTTKLKAVLTPDQMEKWTKMREEMRQRKGGEKKQGGGEKKAEGKKTE